MIYQIRYDINGREKKLRFRITPQAVQSGGWGRAPSEPVPRRCPSVAGAVPAESAQPCLAGRRLHQDQKRSASRAYMRVRARGRAYPRGLRRPFRPVGRLRNREYPTAPNRCAGPRHEINFSWNTNTKTPPSFAGVGLV